MIQDSDGTGITNDDIPALFFQEGIIDGTTKITESIGFQVDNNLENILCSYLLRIINFYGRLDVDCWKVFNTLFNVG